MVSSDQISVPQPAAYLRYYPRNSSTVDRHYEALRRFAARRGLRAPVLYLDNGCPSSAARPRFEQLARAVMDGSHHVLIVPGLWVFSEDAKQARLAVRLLVSAGCHRILLAAPPSARRGGARSFQPLPRTASSALRDHDWPRRGS